MFDKRGKNNFFIALEGIDGVGKTTIINAIHVLLENIYGIKTVKTGLPNYEKDNKEKLLAGYAIGTYPEERTEDLKAFFIANAVHHAIKNMRFWLGCNNLIILSDRYLMSTYAYNANCRLDRDSIHAITRHMTMPDLTILLKGDVYQCAKGVLDRGDMLDVVNAESLASDLAEIDYHYDVAQSYLGDKGWKIVEYDIGEGISFASISEVLKLIQNNLPGIEENFSQTPLYKLV